MNDWERELLEILANGLRVLSVSQIARTWFENTATAVRQARRAVKRLANQGWLKILRVLARPVVPLIGPLVTWRHAEPQPDFVSLSRFLHQRAGTAATLTTMVTATSQTLRTFGAGHASRVKLTQVTHDLHVSELFLRLWADRDDLRRCWRSEDHLPTPWAIRERPDAILICQAGDPELALEYGGDYSIERLTALHDGLASLPLPYEIW